jgi:hypothetical protein
MFQVEADEFGTFFTFFFQQIAVCGVSIFWGAFSAEWCARLSGASATTRSAEAVANIVFALAPAFACGVLLRSRLPHFANSGRFVWLLPATLVAVGLRAPPSAVESSETFRNSCSRVMALRGSGR